eukprot:1159089-Pelagomonas_calceolata.AAC.13
MARILDTLHYHLRIEAQAEVRCACGSGGVHVDMDILTWISLGGKGMRVGGWGIGKGICGLWQWLCVWALLRVKMIRYSHNKRHEERGSCKCAIRLCRKASMAMHYTLNVPRSSPSHVNHRWLIRSQRCSIDVYVSWGAATHGVIYGDTDLWKHVPCGATDRLVEGCDLRCYRLMEGCCL